MLGNDLEDFLPPRIVEICVTGKEDGYVLLLAIVSVYVGICKIWPGKKRIGNLWHVVARRDGIGKKSIDAQVIHFRKKTLAALGE